MRRIAIGKAAAELDSLSNEGVSPPALKNELEGLWHSEPTENRLSRYVPYPKQAAFHAAGATARERLLIGGNQLGKTLAGGFEVAMHMTGRYPAWWCGKRFAKPVTGWVAGRTGEDLRGGMQRI